jgi:hypothetical protein
MKNVKTREEFMLENNLNSELVRATLNSTEKEISDTSVNEKHMDVSVDSESTKAAEAEIKTIGAKIKKVHDFGVIEIEVDPKLVDDIKKIENVTAVEEIKSSK